MHDNLDINILNFQFCGRYCLHFYGAIQEKCNHPVILPYIRKYYNDKE